MSFYHWFVHGEVDWDYWQQKCRSWCPMLSGAFFGAGWWAFIDALVYSSAVLHTKTPLTYHIPGWIATVVLVLMNLVSRDDLRQAGEAYEEGAECRARTWLFFAYLVATGAVAGGVAVLVNSQQSAEHSGAGVVRNRQFIVAVMTMSLLQLFQSQAVASHVGTGPSSATRRVDERLEAGFLPQSPRY